jgi:hypothetical protein
MAMTIWRRAARVLPGRGLMSALLLVAWWGLPGVAAERQVIVEEFTNNN